MDQCPNVKKCVVIERTGNQVNWNNERDVSYKKLISSVPTKCDPEEMGAEDPLFILYTSGSGKPGVLHTTGGYMVYASMTISIFLIINLMIFIGVQQILAG